MAKFSIQYRDQLMAAATVDSMWRRLSNDAWFVLGNWVELLTGTVIRMGTPHFESEAAEAEAQQSLQQTLALLDEVLNVVNRLAPDWRPDEYADRFRDLRAVRTDDVLDRDVSEEEAAMVTDFLDEMARGYRLEWRSDSCRYLRKLIDFEY